MSGEVRDQEEDRAGDVLGPAHAADRNRSLDLLPGSRVGEDRRGHRGLDPPRSDAVDPEPARTELGRQRLGVRDQSPFRRGVGGMTRFAALPRGRRHEDDRAALFLDVRDRRVGHDERPPSVDGEGAVPDVEVRPARRAGPTRRRRRGRSGAPRRGARRLRRERALPLRPRGSRGRTARRRCRRSGS